MYNATKIKQQERTYEVNDQIAVLPVFRKAPAFLDFREDLYFPKNKYWD